MATPQRNDPSPGVRRRGLWLFLGSTGLAVVAAFVLSWLESSGARAKALPLALPFVGMVWGLLLLITGRQLNQLETWFARLPALARLPLGCLGATGLLLVCAVLVAFLWRIVSGLVPPPENVWVYVDNGSERPVGASIDGRTPVVVAPGTFAVLKTTAGDHTVAIRDGSTVVYEGKKTLTAGEEVRKYVLNPDRSQRYVVETVLYGERRPTLGLTESPQWTANRALEKIALRVPDPWVSESFDEVFDERPPQTVKLRPGEVGTKAHQRLCRISAADYDTVARTIAVVRAPGAPPFFPSVVQANAMNRVLAACPR